MKTKFLGQVVCCALIASLSSRANAQTPAPNDLDVGREVAGPQSPDATPVTTAFTYQGQLKRNGGAYSGSCTFTFTLWDTLSGGAQIASAPAQVLTVDNGLFKSELDFGDQFKGDARWLQMAVQCSGDGGATTLSPRTLLTSSPYALSLRPGATVNGVTPGTQGVLRVVNNNAGGAAVVALANAGTGTNYGLLANAFSPSAHAVSAYTSGGATAIHGESDANGSAVRGKNNSGGYGVYGSSFSNIGVYGESTNYEGVRGVSHNINHAAIFGSHAANGFGVFGTSVGGAGVVGTSTSWVGTYGESQTSFGTWGKSNSGSGAVGTSTQWIGVYGESTNYEGVRGQSHNVNHGGVVGLNDAGGIAVYGKSTGGTVTNRFAGYFDGKVGIAGGSDLAEKFDVGDGKAEPGTLVVIDEARPGKLVASARVYDTKVAGVVSGAGGVNPGLTLHQDGLMDGNTNVAIAGRVYVKATASNGAIKPGDLLTTSGMPGHAMKATDRERAYGAVIGKAMSALDKGTGLVLVLVNLQ